jgi:glycosyltransferase involved in cell wall biosynthesis
MRIALIAPFGLRAKGTARARALPLGRALAARGHTVALFIPPYDSPEDAGQSWTDAGVTVVNVRLPSGPGAGSAWGHLRLAGRLLAAVRAWRPDVAHAFKPKGPSGLAAAGLWALGRPPALVVDADDWEGDGGWNDDPRATYSAAQRRFFAWQERFGLSHAGAWTVTSACLRERAIAFGADPHRVFLLHNGVEKLVLGIRDYSSIPNTQYPTPHTESPIPNPPIAILYTRFAGVRPADVIAIWARVRAIMPEALLRVLGRGLGGEERTRAGQPGVEVVGWVEPDALRGALAQAAVALAPWADSPSNRARHSAKILELMAAGVPVVAYAVGEAPATLGEAGVLIPPGDDVGFAQAIIAVLTDAGRRERLAGLAQARIAAHFTWERLAENALASYAAARR